MISLRPQFTVEFMQPLLQCNRTILEMLARAEPETKKNVKYDARGRPHRHLFDKEKLAHGPV